MAQYSRYEASGDIAYATKVARYLSDDFTMWSGNDDMIVPLLSLGASGVISVWSNLDPKMVHDLVAAWHRGEVSLARELQLQYLENIMGVAKSKNSKVIVNDLSKISVS